MTHAFVLCFCLSLADSFIEVRYEPFPDSVSGANSVSFGQRLLLHIPSTQLPQVGILQLSWDQLLQVIKHGALEGSKQPVIVL